MSEPLAMFLLVAVYFFLIAWVFKTTGMTFKRKKKAERLCAYHSSIRKEKGVWFLDSKNCDVCNNEPKGAA